MTIKSIQIKFDPNQDFQLDAIQAVVDVFQGLPTHGDRQKALWTGTVPNLPQGELFNETWLLENVISIQKRNHITPISELAVDSGLVLEGAGHDNHDYYPFTIEMETGTGKTYVYLRTIYELSQKYNFRKFIIVVPSIAIFEGVFKAFQDLKGHLSSLYSNMNVHMHKYDSAHIGMLRDFADSPFTEILVMTVQSFDNASGRQRNNIYKPQEKLPGERLPFEYIQETRPILILDEPQNLKSDLRRAALRTLNPLFSLNYSATHHDLFNHLYALTPFEAYQRGLVKKIQVDGVFETHDLDPQTLILREVKKNPLRAVIQTLAIVNGKTQTIEVELRNGQDLFRKTHHPDHQHGFTVTEISARVSNTFVDFNGHPRITSEDSFGSSKREIFKVQIERTIQRHMETQKRLLDQGIKVLSLFFIDRVANYIDDDGLIRTLFDEAFEEIKQRYPHFQKWGAQDVREGYFARNKPKKGQNEGEAIDTSGSTKVQREAEKEAFELIMRKKGRLLSFDEPVSFIFAHSALKEGWDNPNVFQICTLNQTVSEMKKRQEIGRGLRIPVNQEGERIFDFYANILTVIANESYDIYSRKLQTEYREAGYEQAPPPPTKVGKGTVHRNQKVYEIPEFQEFWNKLCKKSKYRIKIDSAQLVNDCILAFNSLDINKLRPKVVVQTGRFIITRFTVKLLETVDDESALFEVKIDTTERQSLFDIHTILLSKGDRLSDKINKDERLRGFRITEIHHQSADPCVLFTNGIKLYTGESTSFESQSGGGQIRQTVTEIKETWPVFNIVDRVAKASGLTRKSVNNILQEIDEPHFTFIFTNPEGFTNLLIETINEELANHIVEHIEFDLSMGKENFPLDEFFPPKCDFAQHELIEGGETCIYDKVQFDSQVEKNFVQNTLSGNDRKVIAYFKFPLSFKVNLPKILGNYIPDWGILRENDAGNLILQLVRETKGQEDIDKLRFSHEGRKVRAAQKHFDTINVDYRMITDETPYWWRPSDKVFE